MTPKQWKRVKNFKPTETYKGKNAWGDPLKMSSLFINKLDKFRELIGVPFVPHCGYDPTGHAPKSQHYITPCRCVDGHFKNRAVSPIDAYIMAERLGFTGIGLYPNKGNWFIHLDLRKLGKNDYSKRWIRDDEGNYHPLNAITLIELIMPIQAKYEE